ncbi:MAG: adenine phosphoribosyltransferase [Spirochaetes bacterium RBG_13_51_14]|nr:MAG: adenine phosphoribosyltransferase [Spirochaetes bacterium RBG_13_51_14]
MKVDEILRSKIRSIPDFPKKGIIFRDITTLLSDREGFRMTIDAFIRRYSRMDIDYIAGVEARGFLIGGAIAYELRKGLVPIRKKGKLPFKTVSHEYELEYGTDTIEMHIDAVAKGDRVLIIDDLLATGGTALACAKLIEKLGGVVVEIGFIVDLPDVGGRKKIEEAGYSMFSLVQFEGD